MLPLMVKMQEEQPDIKAYELVAVLLLKASLQQRIRHQLWQKL